MAATLDGNKLQFNSEPMFKYIEKQINQANVGADGYVSISTDIPTITGYFLLNATIKTWNNGKPYSITADGKFLIGASNSAVTGLVVRYTFINENLVEQETISNQS